MEYLAPPNRLIMKMIVFLAIIGLIKIAELLINKNLINLWMLLIMMVVFIIIERALFITVFQ